MQFFRDLGSLVEQRWRDKSYSEEAFPGIASEALAETAPYRNVDPWEIIRWVHTTTELPQQQDLPGRFGDPPITLYSGPRFHIDVYFWLDGTTSIHRHAFCGAFQVLLGSSIHSHYSFQRQHEINEHFAVAKIVLEGVALLERGAIKSIFPGSQYIHSLFHLDRPSATITIRTYQTLSGLPQFSYHKPFFAIDPFFKQQLATKQVQSASLLLSMQHPEADTLIGDLIAGSDFHTAYLLLDLAFGHLTGNQLEKAFGLSIGEERFRNLLEIARVRHGELADLIMPVFEEARRQNNLTQRRSQITSDEHRFFLALLLNVPQRATLLDLVKQRFPEQDPVDTVTDWMEELAATKVMGSSESNVLGIDHFDDDYLFVFRSLLAGLSLGQIKKAYSRYSAESDKNSAAKVEELASVLQNSALFKSILFDSSSPVPSQASRDHLRLVNTRSNRRPQRTKSKARRA